MLKQLLSLFRREAPKEQEKALEQPQHEKVRAFHEEKIQEMHKAAEDISGKNKPPKS